MTDSRQNIIVVGALLLLLVVVFLMSNPQEIFNTGTTSFIDTELAKSSRLQVPVRTKMQLGSEKYLRGFPNTIGEWTGYDYDTTNIKQEIGASLVLLRTYHRSALSQPVNLLILYSGMETSFHMPVICYPAVGYEIEEEGNDLVYVKDVSWLNRSKDLDISKLPEWLQKEVQSVPLSELGYWVSVKKLVIFKSEGDKVTDRQIVLYFYIKDQGISPRYGMIRGSAQAPISGSCYASLQSVKALMGEAIPLLFDPVKQSKIYISIIADWGAGGYLTILLLFTVPLAIIAYPVLRARKSSRTKNEPQAVQSGN